MLIPNLYECFVCCQISIILISLYTLENLSLVVHVCFIIVQHKLLAELLTGIATLYIL